MKDMTTEELVYALKKICSGPDYAMNYANALATAKGYELEILKRFRENDEKDEMKDKTIEEKVNSLVDGLTNSLMTICNNPACNKNNEYVRAYIDCYKEEILKIFKEEDKTMSETAPKRNSTIKATQFEVVLANKEKENLTPVVNMLLDNGVMDFQWEYKLLDVGHMYYLTIQGVWADNLDEIAKLLGDYNYETFTNEKDVESETMNAKQKADMARKK